MSSRRSDAALVVKLQPSRRMLVLLVTLHSLALSLLWPLYESLGLFVLLLVPLLLTSLVQSARRYALLTGKHAVTELVIKNNNDYLLGMSGGHYRQSALRRGSYVHPALIILNFASSEKFMGSFRGR
ncbi:protein YgfX [Sulfuriflexus sp.]|uniref:protein YgfX n=1 Tax=Sulfuriflexus sp. TaxID=2015443 RepID=UPI0028CD91B3|nr:protein YgfX [Sulfuriflexus sp.]MDT8402940.1 protein YgfX [Sulfuriflexus sp.]